MSDSATGKAVIMGRIEVVEDDENYKTDLGILIVFDSADAIRKALADGECKFTFGNSPHPTQPSRRVKWLLK